ncbi:MAG: DUF2852 domain-containing protein [Rhodospirillaceae bacterium]|jgi:hypothetical protein|nr:DUF2852 domain-containing protein [Rhodospirillaceae bacterium]
MEITRKLDEYGKGAWIAVMVLSFIVFWPAGLAILAYLIWSGRMNCWKHGGPGRWYNRRHGGNQHHEHGGARYEGASSGNHAFDEYREETLKRLEDEQNEFQAFLERLRHAKDKAEFDQFMDDRKSYPQTPPTPEGGGEQPGA